MGKILDFYDKKYKTLLVIPFIILILAIGVIIWNYSVTGEFINRAVSLKGGVSVDITLDSAVDINTVESAIKEQFPLNDIEIKEKKTVGEKPGLYIGIDIEGSEEEIQKLIGAVEQASGQELNEEDYNVGKIGSSLGGSFFRETLIALLIAFVFMAIVVFYYFRTPIPSLAVIFAAASDIIITIAVVDLLNIKISTAGIAAFLMLIGYSVDTDILLTTKVLKRKAGTVIERVMQAVRTGLMMTGTTLGAVIIALIFTNSETIRQIMIILLIGLLADLINTWIQNVGILRLYLERKHKKENKENVQI